MGTGEFLCNQSAHGWDTDQVAPRQQDSGEVVGAVAGNLLAAHRPCRFAKLECGAGPVVGHECASVGVDVAAGLPLHRDHIGGEDVVDLDRVRLSRPCGISLVAAIG